MAVEETEEAVIAGKKNVYERERLTEREKLSRIAKWQPFHTKNITHHKIQISFMYSSSMLYNSI